MTLSRLAAGVVLGGVFTAVERRLRRPLVDVRLFADRRFTAASVTVTALFAATFGFFYLAMQYLQLISGFSALVTAVAFAPFVVPVVFLSALSFRYSPRVGMHRMLPAGLAVIACGFLSMLALQQDSSYHWAAMCIVIVGAGIGLCTAPATTAIMGSVGDDRQGIGSAINDAAPRDRRGARFRARGISIGRPLHQLVSPPSDGLAGICSHVGIGLTGHRAAPCRRRRPARRPVGCAGKGVVRVGHAHLGGRDGGGSDRGGGVRRMADTARRAFGHMTLAKRVVTASMLRGGGYLVSVAGDADCRTISTLSRRLWSTDSGTEYVLMPLRPSATSPRWARQ